MSGVHGQCCVCSPSCLDQVFWPSCWLSDTLLRLLQCEHVVTPEAVLALDEDQLRGVGLSYAKVSLLTAASDSGSIVSASTANLGYHSVNQGALTSGF